jgi:hypothetical protein
MVIIGLLCFIVAAICESVMDVLQFHYMRSLFKDFKNNIFWDPEISWRNKYKKGDPKEGPKFIGSDTLFVGFTDGWHLFKMFRTFCIFLGIFFLLLQFTSFWVSLLIVVGIRIFFGIAFTIFYDLFQK